MESRTFFIPIDQLKLSASRAEVIIPTNTEVQKRKETILKRVVLMPGYQAGQQHISELIILCTAIYRALCAPWYSTTSYIIIVTNT